jgi:predicted dehydrogenase
VAETAVFVPERPLPQSDGAGYGHYRASPDAPRGPVENEDYVAAILHTASGVLVTLECSRVAAGDQNNYGIEVHGTDGLVAWDYRQPGRLIVSSGGDLSAQSASSILVGPAAGDYGRFQPIPAQPMSYDDTKVIELAGLVRQIRGDALSTAGLSDAVASAEALEAMALSQAEQRWVTLI